MKRLISVALATLGAVALAIVPAGPASAHQGAHTVMLVGNMSITDADWPDGDDHKNVDIQQVVTLSAAEQTQTVRFTGCADEVRVVLDVTISHTTLSGDLLINTHTRLYEGASCSTTDLDAQSRRSFIVAGIPGNTGSNGDKWTVNSDGNKVTVTLVVRNDLH